MWCTISSACDGTGRCRVRPTKRVDEAAVAQLADNSGAIFRLTEHPDDPLPVPTPGYSMPLLYLAGLAAAEGTVAERLERGYAMGSLSMACIAPARFTAS